MKKLTTEEFIKKSKEIHGNKYDYSVSNYINRRTKIEIKCAKHGIFKQNPTGHMTSNVGCLMCFKEEQKQLFIEKSRKIHNNKYDYSLVEYDYTYLDVKIICKKHGIFNQTPNSHSQGCGCPTCYNEERYDDTKSFVEKSKKIHSDKYDYILVNYLGSFIPIEIICKKHGIFKQQPYSHLRKRGCKKCYDEEHNYTTISLINKLKEIHNEKYDYSLVKYIDQDTKIKIICKKHSVMFEQAPKHHLNGIGCPICNESKGELYIRKYLDENNMEYENQKRFNGCKYKRTLPFDFYLPNYNICIEYDGEQHSNEKHYFNRKNNYNETLEKDKIKTDYCKNNNIRLIRVKYNDDILEKLNFIK